MAPCTRKPRVRRAIVLARQSKEYADGSRYPGTQRASVGSTEAATDVVARVGRIDRSIREETSPFDDLCTFVTLDR
jgi:hypothetical protein